MKSWLAKFRISAALDAGKPWPEPLKIAADPELERFARRTEALGRALRSVPPAAPLLHDSIMRAVRTFTPASGALPEQLDRQSGAPASARNLTWSYAAFITAYYARRSGVG